MLAAVKGHKEIVRYLIIQRAYIAIESNVSSSILIFLPHVYIR